MVRHKLLSYSIVTGKACGEPVVAGEGAVYLIVRCQQLLDQLLLAESGDHLYNPVLHFLTHCV